LDQEDKMEMLEVDELGFWTFSACCFTGKLIILILPFFIHKKCLFLFLDSFASELECDVRGSVELRENTLLITLAEIKSAKGQQEAVEQLVKRLTIIGHAAKVIAEDISVSLHGDVYTRRSQWLKDDVDIERANNALHIDVSVSNPISINILKI
jgi:hypothetical protein